MKRKALKAFVLLTLSFAVFSGCAVTPTLEVPLSISRSLDKATINLGDTAKITLNYEVVKNTFTGLIIVEEFPQGWEITPSEPGAAVFVFDPSTGVAKWFLKRREGIESGSITYIIKARGEAGEKRISGEWKAIDIEGKIYKDSISESKVTVK